MTQAPEYRLVPVEPTEAMLSAIDMTHACEPIDQWRAAIAAAAHTAAPAADRAVSEQQERFDKLLAAEHALSDSYLRIREIVGAMNPPDLEPAALFAYVEGVVRERAAPPADRAELSKVALSIAQGYAEDMVRENYKTAGDTFDKLRAAIDALARSTDAPSEPVAWQWRMNSISPWIDCAPGIVCRATPPAAATSTPCASGEGERLARGESHPVIEALRALPAYRHNEIDGEESDGTPRYWRDRPFVSLRSVERIVLEALSGRAPE